MSRVVFCRFCDFPVFVVAGDFPVLCDGCHREARWTTMAPVPSDTPRIPYELNNQDRAMLKGLRIASD